MEPTVNKPNGGKADFLRINLSECLKLQKVSGNEGYSNKAFMESPFHLRTEVAAGDDFVVVVVITVIKKKQLLFFRFKI